MKSNVWLRMVSGFNDHSRPTLAYTSTA